MKSFAYYNENDSHAAQWLRELISIGAIMDGEVDERSIFDVKAEDIKSFTRCHFFAGIGGWDAALQMSGWPTARPVWTGSLPCQPFSVAGKGKGAADERHLWPEFFRLIRECRPDTIFGEQVEGAVKHGWLDGVSSDLEREGYAVGAAVLGAHSVRAPHIRQRLFWVADSGNTKRGEVCINRKDGCNRENCGRQETHGELGTCREVFRLADSQGHGRRKGHPEKRGSLSEIDAPEERARFESGNPNSRLDNTGKQGPQGRHRGQGAERSGGWSDSVYIPCRDGKFRRVPAQSVVRLLASRIPEGLDGMRPEDGFPLAPKIEGSKHLLKGYGNAILPQVAAEFIRAFMEVERG